MKEQGTGRREKGTDEPTAKNSGSATKAESSDRRSGQLRRWAGAAVILLAAAFAVAPQLFQGNSCGHDFDFHLVSWFDARTSWHNLLFYPHWTPSANYGAGEPRFVFYPPLTWMLGAALSLVMPWTMVPIALTFLFLAGTGMATRALARVAMPDGAATLAGCAAIFSGYALFTAYERSAFGELAGGMWIPLLLLYLIRVRAAGQAGAGRASVWMQSFDGSTAIALVIAAAWLSNAPLGVMASYLLAAVAALLAVRQRSWMPVVRASVGAMLGLGLAAIYLVPAAWEQRWVDIREATDDPGLRVENSWLFAHHADAALAGHDSELQRVSWIAVAMIAVALAGILVAWGRGRYQISEARTKPDSRARELWLVLAAIPIVVLLLQLPVSWPAWNLLPKMRFLQFPWRWLVAVEAPMGIFVAAAVWQRKRWRQIAIASVCALVFGWMVHVAGHNYFQVCDDEDAVAPMVAVDKSGAGFEGVDEYAPVGSDESLAVKGLPLGCFSEDPQVELGKMNDDQVLEWNVDQGSCQPTFLATPDSFRDRPENLHAFTDFKRTGYLILRLRAYPAWHVKVNGKLMPVIQRDDGLIAVLVQQGRVQLDVDWTTTPDVIVGRWISAFSLLAITGLFAYRRHRKPVH
jgi:hypothetical protein